VADGLPGVVSSPRIPTVFEGWIPSDDLACLLHSLHTKVKHDERCARIICMAWTDLTVRVHAQDLTVHRTEVHTKLVNIMRERLIASLKQLPALASRWGTPGSGLLNGEGRPSSFADNLVKQLRTLSQVRTGGASVCILGGGGGAPETLTR